MQQWYPALLTRLRRIVDEQGWPAALAAAAEAKRPTTREALQKRFERAGIKPGLAKCRVESASASDWTPDGGLEKSRLKAQITELVRRQKLLLEELEEARKRQSLFDMVRLVPPVKARARPAGAQRTQRIATPVAVVSDLHVEEPVDPVKVGYVNEYNLAIASRVIEAVGEAICWFAEDKRFSMRECVVAIIGDIISGHIHEDLIESTSLFPLETVPWVLERLEWLLRYVAANTKFERIIVPWCDGNHGRNTPRMRIQTRVENSLEWLIGVQLSQRLRDEPRIEFQISHGHFTDLQVHNTVLEFTHGDTFRGGSGIAGALPSIRKALANDRQHRRIDHVILGHFHDRQDFGDVVMNGSGIGIGPYSIANHFPPRNREQTWFLVDAERGKGLCAPIWLPLYDPASRETK
jgi:hypothetical protein